MKALEDLTGYLSRLPGIGKKSASRIAFYLVKTPSSYNEAFSDAILNIQKKIKICQICGSYSESNICDICSDANTDKESICVVEQPQDVITIKDSGVYKGLFHVLGGAINPLNNVLPENLRIKELMDRIKDNNFKEIILATNPNEEGDFTARYILRLLKDIDVKVTRLASGLPIGGDLEYADKSTLLRSFNSRVNFE